MGKTKKNEYRIVNGTSFEGLSIREVYLDKNNKIVNWGKYPASPLAGSKQEVIQDLIEIMKSIDDMLEATKKPILEEETLEMQMNIR